MFSEIFSSIFGGVLLICLCHCSRINGPMGTTESRTKENKLIYSSKDNANNNPTHHKWNSSSINQQRVGNERCLGSLKKWIFEGSGILSGDPNGVRFFLYPNPLEKNYAEEIKFGDVQNLRFARFYPGAPLKIIIHGFTKSYASESVQLIKDAYLMRMAQTMREGGSALNVILVDWESLGKPRVGEDLEGLFYRLAVRNVPIVGRRVGEFIQFLMDSGVVRSLRYVHIIGFSLGAHVAGQAGNTLKEFNAGEAPLRVTGLDPAGPAFYEQLTFSSRHLHKTDGRFVDVIHSNMGAMGTLSTLGHADFYPNGGGPVQQQCEVEYEKTKAHPESEVGGVWDHKLLMINSCSHNKAPQFFAMSILNPQMIACKCDNYHNFKSGCPCTQTAIFGEYCDLRTRGKFYLDI